MRLRHIEVFHAIMQVGTISGAAQVLHISQPAVTKVLQHCELQLGMPLFERVRGKLYPKPEAHRLFAETEKLNRDLQGIRRLAASLKGHAVDDVAAALDHRQIPFLFVSGYGEQNLPRDFAGRPILTKPFSSSQLLEGAAGLLKSDEQRLAG